MTTRFPKNPANGTEVSLGGRTWRYNSTYGVWDKVGSVLTGSTFDFVNNGITLNGHTLSISTEDDITIKGISLNNEITIGAGSTAHKDFQVNGNLDIGSRMRHVGDSDTAVAFSTNRVTLEAGGTIYQTIGVNDCTDFNSTEVREAKLKDYSEHVNAIGTVTSNTAVNFENGNVQTVTVGGNCQFSFSNPPASGQAGTVTLIITNGGAHTTTFASAVKFPGGVAPTLTSSGVDIVSFLTTDAGTTINGFIGGINFS